MAGKCFQGRPNASLGGNCENLGWVKKQDKSTKGKKLLG